MLKPLVILNVVLLAALAWTNAHSQPAVADVLRARLIELVNERGEMRAQLHIAEGGGGELRLRSGGGEIRVKFGAGNDGAILLMMDGTTEPAIRLATEKSGPGLTMNDPKKGARVFAP
jgi:hypothetical protein